MQKRDVSIRYVRAMTKAELKTYTRDELWGLANQISHAISANKQLASYIYRVNESNEETYSNVMDILVEMHEDAKEELRRERENGTD